MSRVGRIEHVKFTEFEFCKDGRFAQTQGISQCGVIFKYLKSMIFRRRYSPIESSGSSNDVQQMNVWSAYKETGQKDSCIGEIIHCLSEDASPFVAVVTSFDRARTSETPFLTVSSNGVTRLWTSLPTRDAFS